MKTFLSFLLCYGMTLLSYGQVINYEIDPAFDAGELFTQGSVSDLLFYSNGKFLVTGSFLQTNDGALPTSRLFPDGQLDVAFGAGAIKFTFYLNHLLGYGGGVLYRVDPDSPELGQSFRFEFKKPPYGGFISAAVNDILVKDDSLLLVGGIFFTDSTDISPNSLRQLCMVDSTGTPVPDFPMVKCEPTNAIVGTINKLSTGEYIIGGRFSSVNGHPTNNIARLHADFSVDTSFVSPLADDGTAFIQFIDSLNRMWIAVPGGFIQNMPSVFPGLIRVLPDGSIDSTFNIPQLMRIVNGMQLPTFSSTILADGDSTFIVGGIFTLYNGYEKQGLIKINDDGSLIPEAFANLGFDAATWDGYTSSYAGVKVIEKLPDGKLLIGGSFSSFGGEPYSCLVRLKPDGFVGIDEKPQRNSLTIYPNPAKESIRIRLPDKNQGLLRVEFYDLSGRLVQKVSNVSPAGEINISTFPQGMYVVKGITKAGVFTGKVLVE